MYGRRRYGRRSYGRRSYGRRYYRRRYYRGENMPLPLVAGVMLGAGALSSSAYSLKQAYETQTYWKDYGRNTGLSPRYPFRSGMYSPYRDIANVSVGFGALYGRGAKQFSSYGEYRGWAHHLAPSGRYPIGHYWD